MREFQLIDSLLRQRHGADHPAVRLGIGDDAALVEDNGLNVTASALLQEGVDYDPGEPAEQLGRRLVELACQPLQAQAAEPVCALLSLALPRADDAWLDAFSRGLHEALLAAGAQLAGGDTTRSPAQGRLLLIVHGRTRTA